MLVVNDNIDFEKYHLYPNVGLLNDPNGLVYFKGKYHVFFNGILTDVITTIKNGDILFLMI